MSYWSRSRSFGRPGMRTMYRMRTRNSLMPLDGPLDRGQPHSSGLSTCRRRKTYMPRTSCGTSSSMTSSSRLQRWMGMTLSTSGTARIRTQSPGPWSGSGTGHTHWSSLPSPTRCSCPTNSDRSRGRIREASGCEVFAGSIPSMSDICFMAELYQKLPPGEPAAAATDPDATRLSRERYGRRRRGRGYARPARDRT